MPTSARGLSPRPSMWTVTWFPLLLLHHHVHVLKSHFPYSAYNHKDLLESLPLSEPLLIHPYGQVPFLVCQLRLMKRPGSLLPLAVSHVPGWAARPSQHQLHQASCGRLPCLLRLLPCIALSYILPFFLLMTQSSFLSWAGALPSGTWHPPALASVLPPGALPLSQPSQSVQIKPRLLISVSAAGVL